MTDDDGRWRFKREGRAVVVWVILAIGLAVWLLACGPRPNDQAQRPSVSTAQRVYRILFPVLESVVLWGLDAIRPPQSEPEAAPDGTLQ